MLKIKKTHKITVFFVLIFLLGVYSLVIYINNTMDQKKETILETQTIGSRPLQPKAFQVY